MPSRSWQEWNTSRASKLDEIEAAHRSIGGTARGRRYATEQINHAYAVLLASQFQGFCRDLHSECVDYVVQAVAPAVHRLILRAVFVLGRGLDRGNANSANIGADFSRLGIEFWKKVDAHHARNDRRRRLLEQLNAWRNAIAHQDFDPAKLGGFTALHLSQVRRWRMACNRLALSFDNIMHGHILALTGTAPW